MKKIQLLERLEPCNEEIVEEIETYKEELYLKRKEKMKGVLVRAKARWIEEGERPTRYFCSLEKRQYTKKYIGCLEIDGKLSNDPEMIMAYIKNFFENEYKARPRSKTMDDIKQLLGGAYPRITEQERSDLEGTISVQEASVALGKLKNDKSPGPDGFSPNFFKVFWEDLGHLLVRSLNTGFSVGMLSVTQRQGVITLLPKPGKTKKDIHS